MYTLQPLMPVDTLHEHGGFVLMLVFVSVVMLMAYTLHDNRMLRKTTFLIIGTFLAGLLAITANESWTTGKVVVYPNKQVIGTLSGFVAEGYATSKRVGKQTQVTEHHKAYVVYAVEGQQVMYLTNPGVAWPERAVLYKN